MPKHGLSKDFLESRQNVYFFNIWRCCGRDLAAILTEIFSYFSLMWELGHKSWSMEENWGEKMINWHKTMLYATWDDTKSWQDVCNVWNGHFCIKKVTSISITFIRIAEFFQVLLDFVRTYLYQIMYEHLTVKNQHCIQFSTQYWTNEQSQIKHWKWEFSNWIKFGNFSNFILLLCHVFWPRL